jgi:hypothetical protein
MQNIEESLAALQFPEPEPVQPEAAPEAELPAPEAVELLPAETAAEAVEALPQPEQPVEAGAEPQKVKAGEEAEDEFAKDGVSLDELFTMKPEIFSTPAEGEEESDDKKKEKKKGKKKGVALEFDESLGEVVGRKKHKRGDAEWTGEE